MEINSYKVVDFEDLSLAPKSFNNGSDGSGGFTSQSTFFNNLYNPTFQSWSGWSYSNTTDTTTPGFINQYSAFPGSGFGGSSNYGVAFNFNPGDAVIDLPDGYSLDSVRITNTTYSALSIFNGDQFAKKFGGVTGNDPDFLLLKINGLDASNNLVNTVDFYLADYRFSDNSKDYVVNDWESIDLSSLQGAEKLSFTLVSSDNDPIFGLNTPAYFALDDLTLVNTESYGDGKSIKGTENNDSLNGGFKSDTIYGLAGNDTIRGKMGNDRIFGGSGNDELYGGNGDDILTGDDGQDKLYGDDGNDILRGGNGDDTLMGGKGDDRLEGQQGNDQLMGGQGNDILFGEQGNDYLTGGQGNDSLIGGIGDDTLDGGLGIDTLTGGSGFDVFRFNGRKEGSDTITDFLSGSDKIFVSAIDFGGSLVAGSFISLDQFTLGVSAIDASDRFIYDKTTGNLFFDSDGTGKSAQVQLATLTSTPDLSNTDIFAF
jgi:Ca2+-binding RTX toxin-like protein